MKLKVEIVNKVKTTKAEDKIIQQHIDEIISRYEKEEGNLLIKISLNKKGEIQMDWKIKRPKFERIRRITGYLVGTVDRWNNGKKAELYDRVKHNVA